jgi:hypothetical protein
LEAASDEKPVIVGECKQMYALVVYALQNVDIFECPGVPNVYSGLQAGQLSRCSEISVEV